MTGHFVEELIHRFEVEQQKNDRSIVLPPCMADLRAERPVR